MFSSRTKIVLFILLASLFAIHPNQFNLDENLDTLNIRGESLGWPSRSIVDLRLNYNNEVYVGTGGGLGKIIISNNELSSYNQFSDANLALGGTPAIIVEDYNGASLIALSGVLSDNLGVYGTGISWSFDNGESWRYIEQPIESEIPECENLSCDNPISEETCECWPATTACNWNNADQSCTYVGPYTTFEWYGQTATNLRISTAYNNISYDISADIENEYIYAASWAGSLRRFKFTDINPVWEVVPLPMDYQDSLICEELPSSYYLDPRDQVGFDNHKVFSVSVQDDIIWAGTANGINKGYINEDNCIDWFHYTSENNNLSGDWTIGFLKHEVNQNNRIWAITWDLSSDPHGLSYSDDEGEIWVQVNHFLDVETKVNNLFASGEKLYASTNNGLYYSDWGAPQLWTKADIPESIINKIGSEKVQSALVHPSNVVLVGFNQGLITSSDEDLNQWQHNILDNPDFNNMLIYPNPYMIDEETQSLTIKIKTDESSMGPLTIYDFSMNKVQDIICEPSDYNSQQSSQYCYWDGNASNGSQVLNGVYFCKFKSSNGYVWDKVIIVNTQ